MKAGLQKHLLRKYFIFSFVLYSKTIFPSMSSCLSEYHPHDYGVFKGQECHCQMTKIYNTLSSAQLLSICFKTLNLWVGFHNVLLVLLFRSK